MRLVTNKWQRRSWGDDVAGLVILTVVGAIVGFITAGVLASIAVGFMLPVAFDDFKRRPDIYAIFAPAGMIFTNAAFLIAALLTFLPAFVVWGVPLGWTLLLTAFSLGGVYLGCRLGEWFDRE